MDQQLGADLVKEFRGVKFLSSYSLEDSAVLVESIPENSEGAFRITDDMARTDSYSEILGKAIEWFGGTDEEI